MSPEGEPEIYQAIKFGAMLENIGFVEDGITPNFEDDSITPNTRVSYPIDHIPGAVKGSKGGHPTDIFFLTCDAFGVLPPLARLDKGQAMYHFLSGYTAKVAGTEAGLWSLKRHFLPASVRHSCHCPRRNTPKCSATR